MPILRPVRRGCLVLAACALVTHAACRAPSSGDAAYFLRAPLVPAVAGAPGSGGFEVLLSATRRSAYAEVAGLAPDSVYQLAFDGVAVADVETDATGAGDGGIAVSVPAHDPRGRRVAVLDAAGAEVLVLADASHPDFVRTDHAPLASFAPGGGYAQLRTIGGVETLVVALQDVEPGQYELVVDGVSRGAIDASGGSGEIAVDPAGLDPENAGVEVRLDGVGLYAGGVYASVHGLDWCTSRFAQQALVPHADGWAVASLRTQVDCGRRFAVDVEFVPMGDYELRVGGVPRGTIYVGEDENGVTLGSIEFSTDGDAASALHFDPVGAPIEIASSSGLHFSLGAFQP
ncbi:MAG: hypothetical protein DCC71_14865 [Proteobacteria bacterium]|nr:MAG: hypothetical protein DCC71_14865 [Pseudomonadota bacterium]